MTRWQWFKLRYLKRFKKLTVDERIAIHRKACREGRKPRSKKAGA